MKKNIWYEIHEAIDCIGKTLIATGIVMLAAYGLLEITIHLMR